MGRGWKDFVYFSKADRRVLLFLAGIFVGMFIASTFFWWRDTQNLVGEGEGDKVLSRQMPADSVTQKPDGEVYFRVEEVKPESFYFDPNTADSTALLRLGLQPWQVRSIYKYRARGGRYHRPEDFSRLYGLTKETYDRLLPFIRIADKYKLMADLPSPVAEEERATKREFVSVKYGEGTQIELNAADTTALKKIPGIGSYYARKIVNYRNLLGGFVALSQLKEIEGLPEDVERWFTLEPLVFRPLLINRLSVEQLRRHPYLNFYQSKVMVEHRRKYGPISDLQDLALYEEFSPESIRRLRPYMDYQE